MKEGKITIFLSHSHKDEEKVRKIRDILETLDCEPLIFFLKCLDDDNTDLEDFIKKEIKARNIFLYCKSKNAEKSEWVQKELDYIRSLDKSRVYEVDIENDFQLGIIRLLTSLTKIIKQSRLFVSYSVKDTKTALSIMDYMKTKDIAVFNYTDLKAGSSWADSVQTEIKKCAEEGSVIMLLSESSLKSRYVMYEVECALQSGADVIPVLIKGNEVKDNLPPFLVNRNIIEIEEDPTQEQLENIYSAMIKK